MKAVKYMGELSTLRVSGLTIRKGEVVSSPEALVNTLAKIPGFEFVEQTKQKTQDTKPKQSKKPKKPAELPEAAKEPSKE
jgi:hypothetical protein